MYVTYDFDYKTDLGEKIQVEVACEYNAPDPYCVDSDWDYQGGFFIDVISLTKDGKPWAGIVTKEELIDYIMEEYDVDKDRAKMDVENVMKEMIEIGIVHE